MAAYRTPDAGAAVRVSITLTGRAAGSSLPCTSRQPRANTVLPIPNAACLMFMTSILSERMLEIGTRAPEGEEGLFMFVVGVGERRLRLEHVREERRVQVELRGSDARA